MGLNAGVAHTAHGKGWVVYRDVEQPRATDRGWGPATSCLPVMKINGLMFSKSLTASPTDAPQGYAAWELPAAMPCWDTKRCCVLTMP